MAEAIGLASKLPHEELWPPNLVFCLQLSEWCVQSSAFNFMPETECTPFAEFEAKNSVERPQLLM